MRAAAGTLPGAAVVLGLLVSGCTGTPAPEPVAPPTVVQETVAPVDPAPADVPVEPVYEAPPLPDPAEFQGLSPRGVHDRLGAPALVRWEEGAQVHQFATGNCIVDVVFYEPAAGAGFAARYLSARDRRGQTTDLPECLASFGGLPLN